MEVWRGTSLVWSQTKKMQRALRVGEQHAEGLVTWKNLLYSPCWITLKQTKSVLRTLAGQEHTHGKIRILLDLLYICFEF